MTEQALGMLLFELGEPAEGARLLTHALAVYRSQLGDDHPYTRQLAQILGGGQPPSVPEGARAAIPFVTHAAAALGASADPDTLLAVATRILLRSRAGAAAEAILVADLAAHPAGALSRAGARPGPPPGLPPGADWAGFIAEVGEVVDAIRTDFSTLLPTLPRDPAGRVAFPPGSLPDPDDEDHQSLLDEATAVVVRWQRSGDPAELDALAPAWARAAAWAMAQDPEAKGAGLAAVLLRALPARRDELLAGWAPTEEQRTFLAATVSTP